jgi:transglutaminase-like putative cysteine protease
MSSPTITVLDHRAMALLLLGLLLVVAPHFAQLPWWESAAVVLLGLWRWLASRLGWRLPGTVVKVMITAVIIVSIFARFGSVAGRDAGIALLIAMLALKLIELRQRRDLLVLMFIAYFVLATHFLYSQTIPMAIYVFVVSWLLVALHIHLTHHDTQPLKSSLRTSALLLGQALPLMLALFVLFPRLPGPIWSLPKDAYAGMTGLDDSMSPGNISNLSQSDAVAFRVSFDGVAPPPQQRYWRGPVLTLTDGRRWVPAPAVSGDLAAIEWRGDPVSYTITLEPHNRRWLFVLDLPASSSQHGQLNSDYQLLAASNVRQRLRYQMVSHPDYNTGALAPALRHATLLLPLGVNPKTVALGQALRRDYHNDAAIIEQALLLYRNQLFTYTLQPPLLRSGNPSDEFLFETRRGFCEHFASSFVMMMRAAGIPARVVTGYQGGELNAVGNYFVIRQRDAHAWAEVWLEGSGWVRVDPTAAVAPERIERGIDLGASNASGAVLFALPPSEGVVDLLQQLRQNLDAIDNRWNQWVLGYGPEQQAEFLQNLGLDIRSWRQLGWTLAVVVGGTFIIITLLVLVKRQPHADPVQQQYQLFCRKLARRGVVHQAHESASDFAQRIATARPDLAASVALITRLYSQLRYGPIATPQQLLQLKRAVNEFKP